MVPNLSDLCEKAKIALFFQLHIVVKMFFNDITIFETRHRYQLQPEDDIRCKFTIISPDYFDKLVKQTKK